ncbi:MAG: M48 family metallopeptidase [Lentisphaerota bacterium]
MDFFAHQDRARRNTTLLVFYYVITVILIIAAIYAVFALVFLGDQAGVTGSHKFIPERLWHLELFLCVTGATLFIVISGTTYKVIELASGGGATVASMLGGTPISHGTSDPDERKILNIVEEMAIASGLPVPPVYIMDREMGINAFAAGFSHKNAVVGVTRGCVKQLNRDELQGVIAHEFSHILNGDMRLNIKLMGVLNGILVITMIGYWLMRCTASSSSSSSGKKKGGNPLPLVGLLIMVVGYIGVFFANIIKAAVSRQREFLADASSVQFTRNPSGISGALRKIGRASSSSTLETPRAQEMSHMFFAKSFTSFLDGLFATHPPLEERIKRVNGSVLPDDAHYSQTAIHSDASFASFSGASQSSIKVNEVVGQVGAFTSEHLKYASFLHSQMPENIKEAMRDYFGAMAVIYAMLLSGSQEAKSLQLSGLKERVEPYIYDETLKLSDSVAQTWLGLRLPMIDMAIPSLKTMDLKKYKEFIQTVEYLIKADNNITLFEYCVGKILYRNLDPFFNKTKEPSIKYKDICLLIPRCEELLSCLAYWNASTPEDAKEVFEKASEKLSIGNLTIKPASECNLKVLDYALTELALASPMIRRLVFDGCVSCIIADNEIKIEEAELLRAIGSMLDCPVPPFLSIQVK